MLRVRTRYFRAADLIRDYETQLAHHGLFVRIAPPADLEQFAPVELTIAFDDQRAVVQGQAVQVAPGVGVAVSYPAAAADRLAPLVERAQQGADVADRDPEHGVGDEPSPPTARAKTGGPASSDRDVRITKADKIQLALRGSKEDRMKIMRDTDRSLHAYILKNPRVGIDEIGYLAKNPTCSVEIIKAVAERREWYQRPEIALGLVRNPKTPVPIAIRMLDYISNQELRRLAKSDGARMAILQAARKKVIGR